MTRPCSRDFFPIRFRKMCVHILHEQHEFLVLRLTLLLFNRATFSGATVVTGIKSRWRSDRRGDIIFRL